MAGEENMSTPFQLADRVRRELMKRADANGSRAVEWELQSFDKVGGRGTLRKVWERLKGDRRIRGRKRCCKIMPERLDDKKKKLRDASLPILGQLNLLD